MSLLSFSGRWHAATIQVSQGEMTALGHQIPIPGAQEDISLQFQSCVNAFLGHNVLSVNVDFCYVFLPKSAKTVLSEDFQSRNSKECVSLRKHKYLRLLVIKKGNMPPCAFSSRL